MQKETLFDKIESSDRTVTAKKDENIYFGVVFNILAGNLSTF